VAAGCGACGDAYPFGVGDAPVVVADPDVEMSILNDESRRCDADDRCIERTLGDRGD
jgi:hypothetical protein